MVYTAPRTWIDEQSDAADFNIDIRDNQKGIKVPPNDAYELNEASNYSTSSTTWTAVDGTNLSFTITTTGGDVFVGFIGSLMATSQGFIDIDVDGVRIINQTDGGILGIRASSTPQCHSFTRLISGLSAGSHTFSLYWRATVASTMTLYAGAGTASYDIHPRFWVRELS